MSKTEAASRLFILVVLLAGMISALAANDAGFAALFGLLFGTALERLILSR